MTYAKSPFQARVENFMRMAEQKVPAVPTMPDEATRLLRAKLIIEEALETCEALGVSVLSHDCPVTENSIGYKVEPPESFNMEESVDGCIDVMVVTVGTLSALGVRDLPHMDEVCRVNESKFPGGKPILREDGKAMKPEGFVPASHTSLLINQGWKPEPVESK